MNKGKLVNFRSAIEGISWPGIPNPQAALPLAMLLQLQQTEWLSPDDLRRHQARQLHHLIQHAMVSVPYYRNLWASLGITADVAVDSRQWTRLPTLARRDVQMAGDQLHTVSLPRDHGKTSLHVTGGSTGEPVRVLGTAVTSASWRVLTLRDHLWHNRDFALKLAAIRFNDSDAARPPDGARTDNWGSATRGLIDTGPCSVLHINCTTDEQARWLAKEDPDYLLTYPTVIHALARHCEREGIKLNRLREVRAFGEILEPHVIDACRRVWGVPIVDTYSSEEFGYLALQCPEQPCYHVQSENVLLEVVDDDGRACEAGEVGRVLVTGLHNFAMPLIRYEIGDYAEVGEPCSCGRGLPVLRRILGRQRNMFTLPDGRTRWPVVEARDLAAAFDDLPPITKFQLVQRTLQQIDVNLVTLRELTEQEEATIRSYLQRGLDYAFDVQFNYVDDIPRTPRGKYEEFRSEVSSN